MEMRYSAIEHTDNMPNILENSFTSSVNSFKGSNLVLPSHQLQEDSKQRIKQLECDLVNLNNEKTEFESKLARLPSGCRSRAAISQKKRLEEDLDDRVK